MNTAPKVPTAYMPAPMDMPMPTVAHSPAAVVRLALELWEYLLRLTLSALFGGLIGLERELRMKGAGIRTHLLGPPPAMAPTPLGTGGWPSKPLAANSPSMK